MHNKELSFGTMFFDLAKLYFCATALSLTSCEI